MKDEERQRQILSLLSKKSVCTVYELSASLGVSESTIQRHLSKMEQFGLVSRTFGNVMIKSNYAIGFENPSPNAKKENLQEKRLLAKAASSFLSNNIAVFLDGSSTCLQISSMLSELKGLVIFTNGLPLANALASKSQNQVFLLGGEIDRKSLSSGGEEAENIIASYHASVAILTAAGLDPEKGFYDLDPNGASLKKKMLSACDFPVFVLEPAKGGKPHQTYPIADLSLAGAVVSLSPLDPALRKKAPKCRFVVAK